MANLEGRLIELEIKLSFQDDFVRKLNDVVRELRIEIEVLQKRLARMEETLVDPLTNDD